MRALLTLTALGLAAYAAIRALKCLDQAFDDLTDWDGVSDVAPVFHAQLNTSEVQ